MSWLTAGLAFLGALIGAAPSSWLTLRGQRQNARTEWRQRLDQALALSTSDVEEQRELGDELLTDLVDSDLGSPSDCDLALRLSVMRILGPERERDPTLDRDGRPSNNEDDENAEGRP
jgi:hypothetical protein